MKRNVLAATTALLTISGAARADDTRVDHMTPARVSVEASCPSEPAGLQDVLEVAPVAAAAIGIGADIAGDIVQAGVTALAGALQQASQAKGWGGEGYASFQFYELAVADHRVVMNDRLKTSAAGCLIVEVDTADPATPALVAEVKLISRGDGFILRPIAVRYPHRPEAWPKKALPLQIQATFSVPASGDNTNAGAYAVAIIAIPPIAEGQTLNAAALSKMTSAVMPLRPTTGDVGTQKTALDTAYAALRAQERSIVDLQQQKTFADQDLAAATKPSDELKSKPLSLTHQVEAAERVKVNYEADANALLDENSVSDLGVTSVQARLVLIEDGNKFGLAVAQALSNRAPAIGSSIGAALKTQWGSKPAWTADDTSYVTAMGAVTSAQQAYDVAAKGSDAAQKVTALTALHNAQASANAAAVAAKKPLPFPGLLDTLGG